MELTRPRDKRRAANAAYLRELNEHPATRSARQLEYSPLLKRLLKEKIGGTLRQEVGREPFGPRIHTLMNVGGHRVNIRAFGSYLIASLRLPKNSTYHSIDVSSEGYATLYDRAPNVSRAA